MYTYATATFKTENTLRHDLYTTFITSRITTTTDFTHFILSLPFEGKPIKIGCRMPRNYGIIVV
ncbi:hypothetical protein Hanom_Chr09g00827161 [Helianthus anomalus]